ncbi:hypothetical protein PGIGA_G00225010 [Pangasianodon gigas]|nr:hypothetical protein [Pangasianodon gigas]
MSSLSVRGVITSKTAEDQTEGCCEDFGYALAQAARSSLRDRSAPPPGPYSHILPAGTRGYISSQACALLCVSAPQPRQHSDREAEGRPESGQRRKGRERGYSA